MVFAEIDVMDMIGMRIGEMGWERLENFGLILKFQNFDAVAAGKTQD